jgi:hypothetical protein
MYERQTNRYIWREWQPTFFRSFPRIWAKRFSPSKHKASRRPFPNIFVTCAYSTGEGPVVSFGQSKICTCHTKRIRRTLAIFLEGQLALLPVVFVLSSTPVFTTLYAKLISYQNSRSLYVGVWRCISGGAVQCAVWLVAAEDFWWG